MNKQFAQQKTHSHSFQLKIVLNLSKNVRIEDKRSVSQVLRRPIRVFTELRQRPNDGSCVGIFCLCRRSLEARKLWLSYLSRWNTLSFLCNISSYNVKLQLVAWSFFYLVLLSNASQLDVMRGFHPSVTPLWSPFRVSSAHKKNIVCFSYYICFKLLSSNIKMLVSLLTSLYLFV